MEISEIAIENFKGIEKVVLSPIRPINTLIGRNNSGKSSVLMCLKLINEYFTNLSSRQSISNKNPTIKVANECFRSRTNKQDIFKIEITVKQTQEELHRQISNFIEDKRHQDPRLDSNKAEALLNGGLFVNLIFDFKGANNGKQFGLTSVSASDRENANRETIVLCTNQNPGTQLKSLLLTNLFMKQYSHNSLSEFVRKQDMNRGAEVSLIRAIFTTGAAESGVQLLNPAFQYIFSALQSIFLVSPYRHGSAEMQPHRAEVLEENGMNLVNYMHDLSLNNYDAFQEIEAFVKKIVPDVGRLHPRFVRENTSELELAYEWPDGRVVNLANMGGGVEQLLILGSILIQQKSSCILWEEPESHLHPGAQDVLLSELESRVGDSMIFMTTHSPVFVRSSDKIAVHICTNKDGKSGVGRTLSENELQEAAELIGSRPGHLAQADIVIYVEGKHGAAVVEEWLKKWPRKNDVLGHLLLVVQPCNPDEMGTDDFDLKKLKKVTPNMLLFVDRDNKTGSKEPKPARKTLLDMCNEIKVPCIITTKRQIEDYFTIEAVRRILPSNILGSWDYDENKPLGEQFRNGWKKYNARIAASMQWEDIEKHKDIMHIFEQIEEYANKLKPEINRD